MLYLFCLVFSTFLLVASVPLGHKDNHVTSAGRDVAQFQSLWGQYAPYTPAGTYEPPSGCTINQVNLVQRHGSRYPTTNQNLGIKKALEKIKTAKKITDLNFIFLTDYKYNIGDEQVNQLNSVGKAESYEAGKLQYSRYKDFIISNAVVPFVHSSSVNRVQDSANKWIEGFEEASGAKILSPTVIVKKSDAAAAARVTKAHLSGWKNRYLPRIKTYLHSVTGVGLSEPDVYSLMSLCPFESSAIRRSTSDQTLSPFCGIFTDAQFKDWAWQSALDKYYIARYLDSDDKYGLSPEGYTDALHTRLSDTKSVKFYADFSHDNEMSGIMYVLGLFPQAQDLSSEEPDPESDFITSKVVPFAARMVVERMVCKSQQFVRVLVNDAVQPLAWCGCMKGGLCPLEEFVKGPKKQRNSTVSMIL